MSELTSQQGVLKGPLFLLLSFSTQRDLFLTATRLHAASYSGGSADGDGCGTSDAGVQRCWLLGDVSVMWLCVVAMCGGYVRLGGWHASPCSYRTLTAMLQDAAVTQAEAPAATVAAGVGATTRPRLACVMPRMAPRGFGLSEVVPPGYSLVATDATKVKDRPAEGSTAMRIAGARFYNAGMFTSISGGKQASSTARRVGGDGVGRC